MLTQEDRKNIKKLRQHHTLQEIGDKYKVSRERIRQILKEEGIGKIVRKFEFDCEIKGCPSKIKARFSWVKRLCPQCRAYVYIHKKNPQWEKYARQFEIGPCKRCHKRRGNRKGLCSSCSIWLYTKSDPIRYRKFLDGNMRRQRERRATDPEFRKRKSQLAKVHYYNKKNYGFLFKYFNGVAPINYNHWTNRNSP